MEKEKRYYRAMVDLKHKGRFWFSGFYRKLTDTEAQKYGDKIIQCEPEKVIIEKALHPTPKIKGCDLLHEHIGHRIIFSLWDGKNRVGHSELSFNRKTILDCGNDFYTRFKPDFERL